MNLGLGRRRERKSRIIGISLIILLVYSLAMSYSVGQYITPVTVTHPTDSYAVSASPVDNVYSLKASNNKNIKTGYFDNDVSLKSLISQNHLNLEKIRRIESHIETSNFLNSSASPKNIRENISVVWKPSYELNDYIIDNMTIYFYDFNGAPLNNCNIDIFTSTDSNVYSGNTYSKNYVTLYSTTLTTSDIYILIRKTFENTFIFYFTPMYSVGSNTSLYVYLNESVYTRYSISLTDYLNGKLDISLDSVYLNGSSHHPYAHEQYQLNSTYTNYLYLSQNAYYKMYFMIEKSSEIYVFSNTLSTGSSSSMSVTIDNSYINSLSTAWTIVDIHGKQNNGSYANVSIHTLDPFTMDSEIHGPDTTLYICPKNLLLYSNFGFNVYTYVAYSERNELWRYSFQNIPSFYINSTTANVTYTVTVGANLYITSRYEFTDYGRSTIFYFDIYDEAGNKFTEVTIYNYTSHAFLRNEPYVYTLINESSGGILYNSSSTTTCCFTVDNSLIFGDAISVNMRLNISIRISPYDTFMYSRDFLLTRPWLEITPDLWLVLGLNSDSYSSTTAYIINRTGGGPINRINLYLSWYYYNITGNSTNGVDYHSVALKLFPVQEANLTRTFIDKQTMILEYNIENIIKFQLQFKAVSDGVIEIKVMEEEISPNIISYFLNYVQYTFEPNTHLDAVALSESRYSEINDYFKIEYSGGITYTYISKIHDFSNVNAPALWNSTSPLEITLFTHDNPSTSLSNYDYLIILEHTANATTSLISDYYYALTKLTKVQQLKYNINSLISSMDSFSMALDENESATMLELLHNMLSQIDNATQMYASGKYTNASMEFNTVTLKYLSFMNLLGDIFHQSFLDLYYTHPESRDVTPVAIFFDKSSCFYTLGHSSAVEFLLTLTRSFLDYNIPFEILNSTEITTYMNQYPHGIVLIPGVPLTTNLIFDEYNSLYTSHSPLATWLINGGNLIIIGAEPLRVYFDQNLATYYSIGDVNSFVNSLTDSLLPSLYDSNTLNLMAQHTDEYQFSINSISPRYAIDINTLPQTPFPPYYLYSSGLYADFVVFAGRKGNNTITFAFLDEIHSSYYEPISSLISQLLTKYDPLATVVAHYKQLMKHKYTSRLADLSTFYDTFIQALSSVEYGRALLRNDTSFDSIEYFLDGITKASLYLDLKGSLFEMLKKNVEKLKEDVLKAINKYDISINKTEIFDLIEKISAIIENQTCNNETTLYDLVLNLTSNIDEITNNLNASINTQILSKVNTFNYTINSLISRLPALLNKSKDFITKLNSVVNETLRKLIEKLADWDFSSALGMGQFLDIALCNATILIYNEVGEKLVNATKLLNSIAYLIYGYLSSSEVNFVFEQLNKKLNNITLMIANLNETRNYDVIIGNLSELILQFAQIVNSSVGGLIDDLSDVLNILTHLPSSTYNVAQENLTLSELTTLHSLLAHAIDLINEGRFDVGLSIISNNSKKIEDAIESIIQINYEKLDKLRESVLQKSYEENANLSSLLVRMNDIRFDLQTAEIALEKQQYKLALSALKDAESKLSSLIMSMALYNLQPSVITSQESPLMTPFVIIGVQYFPYFILALSLVTLVASVIVLRHHTVTKVAVEELQPPVQPPTFKPKSKAIRKICPNYREYNGIHICTSTFPPSIISEKIANKICKSPLHWPTCKPILSNLPLTDKYDPENICPYLKVYKEGAFFKFYCKAKDIDLNKDFAKLVCINNPTWEHCPRYTEVSVQKPVAKPIPTQPSLSEKEICPYAKYDKEKKKYVCTVSSRLISDEEFQTLCSKNYEVCLLYKQGPSITEETRSKAEQIQEEEKTVEAIVEDSILNAPNRCEFLTKDSRGFVCTLSNRVVTEFEVNTLCSKEFHTMCRIYQTESKKKDKFGDVFL